MTRDEFKLLVKGMKAVYPQETFIPDSFAFDMWYEMLNDLDYRIAGLAIKSYMATGKFPPTIADIREKYAEVSQRRTESWDEAWGTVLMAIRKYGYPREAEALASLSERTRRVVRRFGWQNLCMSEKIEVERSNFRDAYNSEVKRDKVDGVLPLQVKEGSIKIIEAMEESLIAKLSMEEEDNGKRNRDI